MKKIPGLSARAMADGGDLARPPHAQVDSVESPGVAVPSVNAATFSMQSQRRKAGRHRGMAIPLTFPQCHSTRGRRTYEEWSVSSSEQKRGEQSGNVGFRRRF